MNIDSFGNICLTDRDAFMHLYAGNLTTLENVSISDINSVIKFNQSIKENFDNFPQITQKNSDISINEFDKEHQNIWFFPNDYFQCDIESYLYSKCENIEQRHRVDHELTLYKKYNMINLLKYLKFLVDIMRENNIVWGVGRGSSVSSYILFLIGIHKIDSVKYQLDIHEFLK